MDRTATSPMTVDDVSTKKRPVWLVPVIVVVVLLVIAIIVLVLMWYFVWNVAPPVVDVTPAPQLIGLKSVYTAPALDSRKLITTWDTLPGRSYRLMVTATSAAVAGTTASFFPKSEPTATSPFEIDLKTPSDVAPDARPSDFSVSVSLVETATADGAEYSTVPTPNPGGPFSVCDEHTDCTLTNYCENVSRTCTWPSDTIDVALKSVYTAPTKETRVLTTTWISPVGIAPASYELTIAHTPSTLENALTGKVFPFVQNNASSPFEYYMMAGIDVTSNATPGDFTCTLRLLPTNQSQTVVATSEPGMAFSSCTSDTECSKQTNYCDDTSDTCLWPTTVIAPTNLRSVYTAPSSDERQLTTTWVATIPAATYRLQISAKTTGGSDIPLDTVDKATSPYVLDLAVPEDISSNVAPSDIVIRLTAVVGGADVSFEEVDAISEPGMAFSSCTGSTDCTQTNYCDAISNTCLWPGVISVYELFPSPRLITSWPSDPTRRYGIMVNAAQNAKGTFANYFPIKVMNTPSPYTTTFDLGTQVSRSAVPSDFTVTVEAYETDTEAVLVGTAIATSGGPGASFRSCVADDDCITSYYCDRSQKNCGLMPAPTATSFQATYFLNPQNPTTVKLTGAFDPASLSVYPASAKMTLVFYKNSTIIHILPDVAINGQYSYSYSRMGNENVDPAQFQVSVRVRLANVIGSSTSVLTVAPVIAPGSAHGPCGPPDSKTCEPFQCYDGKIVPYALLNEPCSTSCCVASTTCSNDDVCALPLATNRAMATGTFAQLREDGEWQVYVTGSAATSPPMLTRMYSIIEYPTGNNVVVIANDAVKLYELTSVQKSPVNVTDALVVTQLRFEVVTTDMATKKVDTALYPVLDVRYLGECTTTSSPAPIVITSVIAKQVADQQDVDIDVSWSNQTANTTVLVRLYNSDYTQLETSQPLSMVSNITLRSPWNEMGLYPIVELAYVGNPCMPRSTSAITRCDGFRDPIKTASAAIVSIDADGKTPSRVLVDIEPDSEMRTRCTIVISLSAQAKTVMDPVSIDSTDSLDLAKHMPIRAMLSAPASYEVLTVTATVTTLCGVSWRTIPVRWADALPACQLNPSLTILHKGALYVTLTNASAIPGGADVSVEIHDTSSGSMKLVDTAKLAISRQSGEVTAPIYGQENLTAPYFVVPFYSATTTPLLGNRVVPIVCPTNALVVAPTDLVAVLDGDTLNVAWKYLSSNSGFSSELIVYDNSYNTFFDSRIDVTQKSAAFKINIQDTRWFTTPLTARLRIIGKGCDGAAIQKSKQFDVTSPVVVVTPVPPPAAPENVVAKNITAQGALVITWGIPAVPPEKGSVNVIELYDTTKRLLVTYEVDTLDCLFAAQTLLQPSSILAMTQTPRGAMSKKVPVEVSASCSLTPTCPDPIIKIYQDPDGRFVTIIRPVEGVAIYSFVFSGPKIYVNTIITKGGQVLTEVPTIANPVLNYVVGETNKLVFEDLSKAYVYAFNSPNFTNLECSFYDACYNECKFFSTYVTLTT